MKNIKTIRVFLTILLFAAAVGYAFFTPPAQPMAVVAPRSQIVPSMLAYSIGAILFWLVISFLGGRLYCAAFCPVGAIQDGVIFLRRKITGRVYTHRTGHYRRHGSTHYQVLVAYVVCLVAGQLAVPYVLEPWNMFCNIASVVHPDAVDASWIRLGVGATTGVVAGVVSLLAIVIWAWVADRDFCNTVCPIGTILGLGDAHTLMHIEIDPDKCINCMKCEEVCRAGCVKVVSRYVDNSRCVRCFDCLEVCDNEAIRYQHNRNRPASPLTRRVRKTTP